MTANLPPGITLGGWPAFYKRLTNLVLIGLPVAGSILAIWNLQYGPPRWSDVLAFLVFYAWTGLGVALGLHRLFSHHSFRAHPTITALLCAGGTMAFQGSPLRWVLDHRRHHALVDRPGDVHSPYFIANGAPLRGLRGFWHAHLGWMFDPSVTDESVFGKGLRGDRMVMFFTHTHFLWLTASLGLPYLLGVCVGGPAAGWSALLWGGCLRATVLHNVVWSVNSFGHMTGRRTHRTGDRSTDNRWLALLSFGEGWHNGHHLSPRSYRHGVAPAQPDFNAAIIRWLERRGLAADVVNPADLQLKEDSRHA